VNAENRWIPTARTGRTSKRVRLPRRPRNDRATLSCEVHEETPTR